MDITYRHLLKEYNVDLDNPVLDKAFVSKAKDFEEKLKNKELTDDEIKAFDAELVELFNTLHDFAEVDSEEIEKARKQKEFAEAKAAVSEAETIEDLQALETKFKKEFPELVPVIEGRITKLQKKQEKESMDQLFAVAKQEIAESAYDNLQAVGEKYKQYPELVAIVNKRIEDERPKNEQNELAEKLRSRKEWSYKDLRAMGVEPTGNDMTVAGVRLEKEYLLNIYAVRK